MKFLVVGGGSMGKRRIRCLQANGVDTELIRLVDGRKDRIDESHKIYDVSGFSDLALGLDWNPDAVLVSVPGAHHFDVMRQAIDADKHVFCEVPLATSSQGLDELAQTAETKSLVLAPGCQHMFDPLILQLRDWMNDPNFGPVLTVLEEFGAYLPDWHPYEDYRKFYASDIRMGGSNVDVVAQEVTSLLWLLGSNEVSWDIQGEKLSTLDLNGCDYWRLAGRLPMGPVLNLQYDLIQRIGRHAVKIVSEQAVAEIDWGTGQGRCYFSEIKEWHEGGRPSDFNHEQCYIDEITHFLKCIKNEATWPNPVGNAITVVGLIEQMVEKATAAPAHMELVEC